MSLPGTVGAWALFSTRKRSPCLQGAHRRGGEGEEPARTSRVCRGEGLGVTVPSGREAPRAHISASDPTSGGRTQCSLGKRPSPGLGVHRERLGCLVAQPEEALLGNLHRWAVSEGLTSAGRVSSGRGWNQVPAPE